MSRTRIVALAAVVVLLAGSLALGLWLAGRALAPLLTREHLEATLAGALGRPVRVERVALELWRGRVVLDGIAVAAGPSWDDGTLLQAPRLVVGARLASLWHRELVLRVVLRQPTVRLVAGEAGAPMEMPASVPDRFVVGPVSVRVGAVEVQEGEVSYADPARAVTLAVASLDARAAPAAGGLDVRLRAERVRLAHAALVSELDDVTVTAALHPDRLHLEQAGARFAGERLELHGDVTDLPGARRLALQVHGSVPLGALSRLAPAPLALDGIARIQGSVGGTAANPTVDLRLAVPALRIDAVEARTVEGRLGWDGAVLTLSDVKARALGGRVAGSVSLPGADPARAHAQVRVEGAALPAVQRLAGRELGVEGVVGGEAELQGDLRRPLHGRGWLRLSADRVVLPAALAPLGAGTVRGEATIRDGGLDIAQLDAAWPGVSARVSGRATVDGAEALQGTLTADLGSVGQLAGWPDVAGAAVVSAEASGPWTAPRVAGRADVTSLQARGARLERARVPFAYADRALRVDGAEAGLGQSRVEVTALARLPAGVALGLDELRRALRVEADLRTTAARVEDLAAWLPEGWPAAGGFRLQARVDGTPQTWRVRGQATAPRLSVRGQAVEDAAMRFDADPAALELSGVAARVHGVPLAGGGVWRWEGSGTFHAEAAPVGLDALLADWPALEPAGRVRGRAEAAIDPAGVVATLALAADEVALAGMALGAGQGRASLSHGRVEAELQFPAARLEATASGRLDGPPLSVRVQARDVDARPLLARWASQVGGLSVRGSLSAELRVPVVDPAAAQGTVRLDPLVVEVAGETWRAAGPVVVERLAATTRLARAELASRVGTLSASGTADDGGAVDIRVRGQVPLAILPIIQPKVLEAAGTLDATLRVGGRLAAPEVGGEGTIAGGRLTLEGMDDSLRDVRARFTVSPGGLRLEDASAAFGGGTLAARGDVALAGVRVRGYRVEVTARQVGMEPLEGLDTTWDADLEVVGGPARGQVRGEGRLLRGRYDRDLSLVQLVLQRRPAGAPAAGGLHLDVRLALQDNLTVTTDVARLRIGGTLQVQGTTAAPVVFGTLTAREGQLVFRRHRFEVTHAAARFVDPRRIDPVLDVQAATRIRTYDVRLAISGRPENLEVRLSSTPPLPEEDLLALVAFGQTREQLAQSGGGVLVGEAAGLLVRELFGAQAGRTGLDVLELERAPETGATSVRVGKEIAPRTLVIFSQGIENTDERKLRIEYQVVGPLGVAGEQDFRGGFGADVFLRVRFR
ncbi:MAG TPA: translocation/assembly module TamB domain-containing protein [Methylomirabilota bacterium]